MCAKCQRRDRKRACDGASVHVPNSPKSAGMSPLDLAAVRDRSCAGGESGRRRAGESRSRAYAREPGCWHLVPYRGRGGREGVRLRYGGRGCQRCARGMRERTDDGRMVFRGRRRIPRGRVQQHEAISGAEREYGAGMRHPARRDERTQQYRGERDDGGVVAHAIGHVRFPDTGGGEV